MNFKYFYGTEADHYTFYRIPKILFTDDRFRKLSSDAKILYGLALDRLTLSIKNNWFDEENRAYIYFSIEDIMEALNCGRNKAIKTMQELDSETGIGLIEKKRQGLGKSSVIYVKSFVVEDSEMESAEVAAADEDEMDTADEQKFTDQTSEEKTAVPEVYKTNFKKFKNQTSRSPENKLQEVYISNPNYNKYNNTYMSDIESNHILSGTTSGEERYDLDEMEKARAYADIIAENIELRYLKEGHPGQEELIDGIYDLILETVLSKRSKTVIASNEYPTELVRSKFLKLDPMHIEYVLECLQKNSTKVWNIKKYLLAALFNAPSTISSYYTAEVNHDNPCMAAR